MKVDIPRLLYPDNGGLAGKIRWQINRRFLRHPAWLSAMGQPLTVLNAFDAAGDTLLTGIVCRNLKERHPGLRINCITQFPELLENDPHIETLNQPETYFSLRHWYLHVIEQKLGEEHVLRSSLDQLGISDFDYHASVYLTAREREAAKHRLGSRNRPLLSFHLKSKEPCKCWPEAHWMELLKLLAPHFDLIHLGDQTEPAIPGVFALAGHLSLRESMAVLSHMDLHVGADSFLMHAANGLKIPSVILFGGSRTPANSGYAENINLFTQIPCGPCYIHAERGEVCGHDLACLQRITPEQVYESVISLSRKLNLRAS